MELDSTEKRNRLYRPSSQYRIHGVSNLIGGVSELIGGVSNLIGGVSELIHGVSNLIGEFLFWPKTSRLSMTL
ncbi:hypothetical protein [Metabacillus idriensis]|uniref:hypothetical protein n=1 Tax=Metabacillus idriensis TaxID=324768 RepID=UPI003D29EA98